MTNTCLIFPGIRANMNAISVLTGAVEEKGYISNYPVFVEKETRFLQRVQWAFKHYQKIIVGFSFYSIQVPKMKQLLAAIKRMDQEQQLLTIAGGPHCRGHPIGALKLGFDAIIPGEGEISLNSFLYHVENEDDWRKTPGIYYWDDTNTVRSNSPPPLIDLNEYPPFSLKQGLFRPLEITRGCSYACTFCETRLSRVRHRSVENVAHYVRIMAKRGLKQVRFISPNALSYGSPGGRSVNLEVLEAMLSTIRTILGPEGKIFFGSFPSEVRPEFVSEESIRILKKYVSNTNILLGAQSGSSRMLKDIKRGHDADVVINAVKILVKYGFEPRVDVIFGLPGETLEDALETVTLMKKLIALGARIHVHTFMPLVGTPLQNARPGQVYPEVRKILYQLAGEGRVYGQWETQERIAQQLASEINIS